jgi:hypothetical protein
VKTPPAQSTKTQISTFLITTHCTFTPVLIAGTENCAGAALGFCTFAIIKLKR